MDTILQLSTAAAVPHVAGGDSWFEVRTTATGRALCARRQIPAGTRLFGEDDWADESERKSFSVLTAAQLNDLSPAMRTAFVHFGYNTAPDQITGTFHREAVRHPVNFMNHSCEPNVGYDGADSILALRRISPDEELRMDYGTYSFSFDHEFRCTCAAPWCRGSVRRDDWRALVRTGLRLPGFMRASADRALWG
jgi:hypothetical protein